MSDRRNSRNENWFDNTKQANLCKDKNYQFGSKDKYITYDIGSNSKWDFMQQGATREKVR
jgi:hypothetical protein